MTIPLLDKELWEDYADDEQEEAYDMLQDLKAQCDAEPTMLYINENEELQSYLMWFARMEDLTYEVTEGNTRVCLRSNNIWVNSVWVLIGLVFMSEYKNNT
jgi:hypothetical protein